MFPHERSLVKRLKNKPFALVGVNSDADRRVVKELNKKEEITWRSFWNGPEGTAGPISEKWNVGSWPTIYVLDAKGVIRYKDVRPDEIDEIIDSLLAEMGVHLGQNDQGASP